VAGTPAVWCAGTGAGGAAWVEALRVGCERDGAGPERPELREERCNKSKSLPDTRRIKQGQLTGMVSDGKVAARTPTREKGNVCVRPLSSGCRCSSGCGRHFPSQRPMLHWMLVRRTVFLAVNGDTIALGLHGFNLSIYHLATG
jgi:hypothetical protein